MPAELPPPGVQEFELSLPAEAAATGYDHVTVDWNPHGHIPEGFTTGPISMSISTPSTARQETPLRLSATTWSVHTRPRRTAICRSTMCCHAAPRCQRWGPMRSIRAVPSSRTSPLRRPLSTVSTTATSSSWSR
ncbi:hypothetical protein [Marinobacterium aestuariivivens]|uniref:Fibronectin type-III domain-containing protein n=1 Tax=Marinobacterium aestuariivivens TaxID=1698799 RepID=A0ABW1ZZ02_9GAMM